MIEVIMPKLGLTMEEGTIVRWLKREGEGVKKGKPLFEVQTDIEVSCRQDGFEQACYDCQEQRVGFHESAGYRVTGGA